MQCYFTTELKTFISHDVLRLFVSNTHPASPKVTTAELPPPSPIPSIRLHWGIPQPGHLLTRRLDIRVAVPEPELERPARQHPLSLHHHTGPRLPEGQSDGRRWQGDHGRPPEGLTQGGGELAVGHRLRSHAVQSAGHLAAGGGTRVRRNTSHGSMGMVLGPCRELGSAGVIHREPDQPSLIIE